MATLQLKKAITVATVIEYCNSMKQKIISFFIPDLNGAGAEMVAVNLANEMARQGYNVHMTLMRKQGDYLSHLHPNITVFDLQIPVNQNSRYKFKHVVGPLTNYLREQKPDAMIVYSWPLTFHAALTKKIARSCTKIIASEHICWSAYLKPKRFFRRLKIRLGMALAYRLNDVTLNVSLDASRDLERFAFLPKHFVNTIYNPYRPQINEQEKNVLSSWNGCYKILSVGRLSNQKNYPLLLEALALVRKNLDASLVILGRGEHEAILKEQAKNLGISKYVSLAGFVEQPLAYYQQADLYVMSSDYEGLPNVLLEALSQGLPIVSTNCPTGPREILDNGKFGLLSPVGDAESLAENIVQSLTKQHDKEKLIERSQIFNVETITKQYLSLIEKQVVVK